MSWTEAYRRKSSGSHQNRAHHHFSSFSVRGLDVLAAFGFEPSAQRWLIGVATVPVAIFFAILFCPVNDFSVALSRRFGSALFGRSREAMGPKSWPA
ncbi:MAG: hypothetical protein WA693_24270 [Pseudolabrys sp.]